MKEAAKVLCELEWSKVEDSKHEYTGKNKLPHRCFDYEFDHLNLSTFCFDFESCSFSAAFLELDGVFLGNITPILRKTDKKIAFLQLMHFPTGSVSHAGIHAV